MYQSDRYKCPLLTFALFYIKLQLLVSPVFIEAQASNRNPKFFLQVGYTSLVYYVYCIPMTRDIKFKHLRRTQLDCELFGYQYTTSHYVPY